MSKELIASMTPAGSDDFFENMYILGCGKQQDKYESIKVFYLENEVTDSKFSYFRTIECAYITFYCDAHLLEEKDLRKFFNVSKSDFTLNEQGSVDLSDERMNAANEGVYRKIELVMDGAISDAYSVVEKLKARMTR